MLSPMGRWVFASALVAAGLLLGGLGVGQLDAAFATPVGAASGRVTRVIAEAATSGAPRYAFELAGRTFQLASPALPHPDDEALKAARSVTVDYDAGGRIMGLNVDGAVFYAPSDYSLLIGASALVALLPGALMIWFGVSAFRRKPVAPRAPARRRARTPFVLPEPTMAVILPFRRSQKTPEGEWVH